VKEFEDGDEADGFVVEDGAYGTGMIVSYPKFTTKFGTQVSFKRGLWREGAYDSVRLKVINLPVLKAHGQYAVTGAVKAYMGVPSNALTRMAAHHSVGEGGLGTLMAHTRMPALNILDMIYIMPEAGPAAPYERAVQKNMIAASTDPIALDYWASKNVLLPAAKAAGSRRAAVMSPDFDPALLGQAPATTLSQKAPGYAPGTFGYWLKLTWRELAAAGIPVVSLENAAGLPVIPAVTVVKVR